MATTSPAASRALCAVNSPALQRRQGRQHSPRRYVAPRLKLDRRRRHSLQQTRGGVANRRRAAGLAALALVAYRGGAIAALS